MNKTKRTLIISSCIMALTLVVAIVGVSAAWFGDMRQAKRDGFTIQSDTLQDVASIDINSSKGMSGEIIYPAVATPGYFSRTGAKAPEGSVLKNGPLPTGVDELAKAATVYFPIQFIGTADPNFETENRKSLDLKLRSVNTGIMIVETADGVRQYRRKSTVSATDDEKLDNYAGTWSALDCPTLYFDGKGSGKADGVAFDYTVSNDEATLGQCEFTVGGKAYTVNLIDFIKDFNVEMCLVEGTLDGNGRFLEETGVVPTSPSYNEAKPLGSNVFYDNYGNDLYMLIQPGITYYVKVVIYFNKIDEECDLSLLNTTVRFNFKLNILADGDYIRNGQYKGGAA